MTEKRQVVNFKLDPKDLLVEEQVAPKSDCTVMTLRRRDVPGRFYPVGDLCIANTKHLPIKKPQTSNSTTTSSNNPQLTQLDSDEPDKRSKGPESHQIEASIYSIFLLAMVSLSLIAVFCNGLRHQNSMITATKSSLNSEHATSNSLNSMRRRPPIRSNNAPTSQSSNNWYAEQIPPPRIQSDASRSADSLSFDDGEKSNIQTAASRDSHLSDQDRDQFMADQDNHYRGRDLPQEMPQSASRRGGRQSVRWSQPLEVPSSSSQNPRIPDSRFPSSRNLSPSNGLTDDGDYDDENPPVDDSQSSPVPEKRRIMNDPDGSRLENLSVNDDSDLDDYNAVNADSHFARKADNSNIRKHHSRQLGSTDKDPGYSSDRRNSHSPKGKQSSYVDSDDERPSFEPNSNEALRSEPDDDSLYTGASASSQSANELRPHSKSNTIDQLARPQSDDSDEDSSSTDDSSPNMDDNYKASPSASSTQRARSTSRPTGPTPRYQRNVLTSRVAAPSDAKISKDSEPYKAPITYSPRWDREPRQIHLPASPRKSSGEPNQSVNSDYGKSASDRGQGRRSESVEVPYNPQNNPSHAGKYFIN